MFKEFFFGISAYAKAHRVILEYKLWPYMIIPGIMSFSYILILIITGNIWFDDISAYINAHFIPDFLKGEVMQMFTTLLCWVLLFLTGYVTYQPIILVLFSPILGYLSEITENRIFNQKSLPFNFKNIIQDIIRSLIINFRNIMRMVFFIISAWILIIIPVIGALVSTCLIFMIQSFYNGFSLTDYTLERKRYSVKESIEFIRKSRSRTMGIGTGFMLMMLVPVLGWLTAPAYGTVAATIAALDKMNDGDIRLRQLDLIFVKKHKKS